MSKIVYGLPYKGSKRRHAETILRLLPCADSFIDGCAGGGAVGQCAVHSGKYKSVTMNEIIPGQCRLLRYAFLGEGEIDGKAVAFADREEFKRAEHEYHHNPDCSVTDAVIAVCCSFGNNCQRYLWGEENYQVKSLVCKMLYADTPEERRQWWLKLILKIKPLLEQPRPEFLQSLQRLESLQRLQTSQYGF